MRQNYTFAVFILILAASAFYFLQPAVNEAIESHAAQADVSDRVGSTVPEVVIPISVESGFVVVDVDINGRGPLPMLFDTGAENAVTPETAEALGLPREGSNSVQDSGGNTFVATYTTVRSLRLASVELADQRILVVPLPKHLTDRGSRRPLAGFIGYGLLSRFVVRLDYESQTLTIRDPKGISADANGAKLPLLFSGKVPAIEGAADDIPGVFLLDTGSVVALTLRYAFVEKHGLEARHPSPLRVTTIGAGGPFETILTRLDSVDVAGSRIYRPATRLPVAADQGLPFVDDGSVGYEILRQFIITFDYPSRRLWFEHSKAFGTQTGNVSAGFQVVKDERGSFKVTTVLPNSAASGAGMQIGDIIVAIDGSSTATMSLSDFATLVRRPLGSMIKFDIDREGIKRSLQLKLKDVLP